MHKQSPLNRRLFLVTGLGIANVLNLRANTMEQRYRLTTRHCDIGIRVVFHDRYSSRGFWFKQDPQNAPFCLSLKGEKNRNCLSRFVGSLAIAQYEIHSRSKKYRVLSLREHVRTIDRDERLDARPPFERRLTLEAGRASDIQAFGYEEDPALPSPVARGAVSPWYYFRQDLYLEADPAPFLIIHWKHELSSIRMLDIIPGEGTSVVSEE